MQHAAFAAPDLLRQELGTLKAKPPPSADPFFTADGGKPLVLAGANLAGVKLPADTAHILRLASRLKITVNENDGI